MAKTPDSHCRGTEFDSWSGNEIPQATARESYAALTKEDPTCSN